MLTTQEKLITSIDQLSETSYRVMLCDELQTTVHAVRYDVFDVQPRVVVFDDEKRLTDYCRENGVTDAIGGGFFVRAEQRSLGEYWVEGKRVESVPFMDSWHQIRGSLMISARGDLMIDRRDKLPVVPENDLLQAGPLLLRGGEVQVARGADAEGFSSGESQFDSDITAIRHPRAAIGLSGDSIWAVVCDGRSETEAGLHLDEFAEFLGHMGIYDALNLDGGSSASLVRGGKLVNQSRIDHETSFEDGRPILSAVIFQ